MPGGRYSIVSPLLRLKYQSDDILQCMGCDHILSLSPGASAEPLPSVGLRAATMVTGTVVSENQLPLLSLSTLVPVVWVLGNKTEEEFGHTGLHLPTFSVIGDSARTPPECRVGFCCASQPFQ